MIESSDAFRVGFARDTNRAATDPPPRAFFPAFENSKPFAGVRSTVGSCSSAAASSAAVRARPQAGRQGSVGPGTGGVFASRVLPSCPAAVPVGRSRRPTALAASHGGSHTSSGKRLGAGASGMGRRHRNIETCGGEEQNLEARGGVTGRGWRGGLSSCFSQSPL